MNFLILRSEGCSDIDSIGSIYAPSFMPPLSLMYVGSALENDGHTVEIVDFAVESSSKTILKKYLNTTDAVGISVYSDNIQQAADIAKMIKEFDSKIPIIIGGPHCIFLGKQSLKDIPHADISVIGEGEKTIIDIVRFIQGKKNLSQIPGIFYRKNGSIRKGKSIEVIKDLDSLHFPSRSLVDKYDYGKIGKKDLFKPRFTSMITSRGCPFRCRFCARYGNAIKGWGSRMRSAEDVIKEFQEIDGKYGTVMVVDDNFILDKKRAHNIMDGLIDIGTNIELLIMGVRVDSADRDLFKKMKKANVKLVGYGIESGNQDVLDFYKKGFTLGQARNAVCLSREMGFKTLATFILGAPIETKEHLENTIKFSCSLPLDFAIYGVLHYEMGSDLWSEAVKNKKISKDEFLVPAGSNRDLGNFTTEYLYEYTDRAYRHFYLRPKYIINQIFRDLLQKDIRSLRSGIRFLTVSN